MIVPDQRGHGRSDLSESSRWNLDTWADDLAALIDALGLQQPVVLGMSFGGFVVQHYLSRHPDQSTGAVLVATSARIPAPDATAERFRAIGGDRAAAAITRSFREQTPEAEREWMQVCEPLTARRPAHPDLVHALRHRIETPDVSRHFTPTLTSMDLRPGLARVRCPVLVLAGWHDPLLPPGTVAEMLTALPDGLGELQVQPDAAHDVLVDTPDAAHAAIREFVQRVAPCRAPGHEQQ